MPPREFSIGPPGDYPSGGAARTVITFGLLAHLLTSGGAVRQNGGSSGRSLRPLVAAQGGSRLYLGRHWPEDVLGGWLLGWLVLQTLTRVDEISSAAGH